MSMFEAVRKLPGLFRREDEDAPASKKPGIVEEYEQLLLLARAEGRLDRQSPTWAYVASWAAKELLKARARMDVSGGEQAAAMRERARVLKELLSIDFAEDRKRIEVKGHAPDMP